MLVTAHVCYDANLTPCSLQILTVDCDCPWVHCPTGKQSALCFNPLRRSCQTLTLGVVPPFTLLFA